MAAKVINSISFQNFYNYYGSYENNTYAFKDGLNIIVADNGAGKSKFFNGILWILKNIIYDSELKMEFNVKDMTFKIISDKAKDEALIKDAIKVGVKLSYQDSKNEYLIEKYFYSTRVREGKSLDEKCWQFDKIEQEVSSRDLYLKTFKPIYDIEEQRKIINNLILPGLQPYALLQGEEIDNIIDFSKPNSLNEAINKLTDIKKIKELVFLSQYLSNRSTKDLDSQRKIHTKNKNAVDEKLTNKDKLISKLKEKETLLETTVETLNRSKEEKDRLMNNITNAGRRNEFRTKIKNLEEEEISLKDQYEKLLNEINSYFFDSEYSWILMNLEGKMKKYSNIKDEYIEKRERKKIEKEGVTNAFITSLPDGSPDYVSLEKMIEQEICFVCGREAKKDSEEWLYMKKIKERPHSTSPKKHTPNNDLRSFFGEIQMSTQEYYRKIIGIKESIKSVRLKSSDYEEKIRNISRQKEEAEQELFQFGGNLGDKSESEKDKNSLQTFANANQRIGQCEIEIGKYQKDIEDLKIKINNIDYEIKELSDSNLPKEYEDTVAILNNVQKIIINTKNRIFSDILERLGANSNIHFQKLTSGNNINGGILKLTKTSEETAIIEVVDEHGNPITGLSEGFQRMKKLAVVMAIISSRNENQVFDYPLIADAPLSAFGKGFIEGFFNEVPNVFNQSIILVKELYDREKDNKLSESGERILKKSGIGCFYINEIEENKPQIERITTIQQYK